MKKVLLFKLWLGYVCLIAIQMQVKAQQLHPSFDIPKIIPPVGVAAAFARYGEIPVDISTGVPNIEVPIYTVTSRRLSVPLSLSYHASGIKVDDIATSVGLGWTLKGMGVVNRTVLGLPDEMPLPQIGLNAYGGKATYTSAEAYQDAVNNCPTTRSARVALGTELYYDLTYRDAKSDRFTFSLPTGGSGTFRYDFNTGNCIVIPNRPLKITKGLEQYGTPYNKINFFNIIDENGIVYGFTKAEKNISYNCGTCYNGSDNVSWYITSIRTPDGGDVIEYQYKTGVFNKFKLKNYSHSYSTGIISNSCPGSSGPVYCSNQSAGTESFQYIETFEPLLEKIISATTIVEFIYANDRIDWEDADNRLSAIRVYDKLSNSLIKEIILNNNSYFGSNANNKRLKLNSVVVKDNNNQPGETYSFNYENSELPPYGSFSQDFWGYYNGQVANTGLVPLEFVTPVLPQYGNIYAGVRLPNHSYAKACMLNEVIYPTGGKTSFEFEPNYAPQMMQGVSSGQVGGFRIKRIKNYTSAVDVTPVSQKAYSYDQPDFAHYIESALFSQGLEYDWDYSDCSSMPGAPPSRTTTQSSSFSSLAFSNGAPVIYTQVVEFDGTETNNNGKTEYNFSSSDDPSPEPWTTNYGPFWYDNGIFDPKLVQKKVFKNTGGTYVPVSSINNTYTVFNNNTYSTGVHAVRTSYDITWPNDSYTESGYLFGSCCGSNCLPRYIYHFSYKNCVAATKVALLTQTAETYYSPDGTPGLTTNTSYHYSNTSAHLQPTTKKVITSTGEELVNEFMYPPDANFQYYPFAYNMTQANILMPVIRQRDFKENTFLGLVENHYNTTAPGVNQNLIVPSLIKSQTGTGPIEDKVTFHDYDIWGNLRQVSKQSDVNETYLYGYNSSLPVAKIMGSSYNVAKTYVTQSVLDNPASDAILRAHLDNLRNIPNAFVTTYTYKPLVGITSETDPRGRTTYYQYDGFNRLNVIKDHDGNIVKRICYNYAGQPEDCPVSTVASFVCNNNSYTVTQGNAQNITISFSINIVTAGYYAISASGGDGSFSGYSNIYLPSGTSSVNLPVSYNGNSTGNTATVTIAAPNVYGNCQYNINILQPPSIKCDAVSLSPSLLYNSGQSQNTTLTIGLNNAATGTYTFYLSNPGNNFSPTSFTKTITAPGTQTFTQTITFDGSSANSSETITITASGNGITGSCIASATVTTPSSLNCGGTSLSQNTFINNNQSQMALLTIGLSNAVAGTYTFNINSSGGNFMPASFPATIGNGQTSVSQWVTFDGSANSSSETLTITAASGFTGVCYAVPSIVASPPSINCGTTYISTGTFFNNSQSQNATLTVGLTNAVAGTVTFTISGSSDFTPTSYPVYINNGQSSVNIPVTFDGTATPGNYTLGISASGYTGSCNVNVTVNSSGTPDLSPSLMVLPAITHGITNMELTCQVWNVGTGATTGQVKVYVSKDDKVTLSWNPTATSIGGLTVHNSQWTLDATSNYSSYIFTTNSVINGGETNLNFGANLVFNPGGSSGNTAITATILQVTGETNLSNNADAESITYFAGGSLPAGLIASEKNKKDVYRAPRMIVKATAYIDAGASIDLPLNYGQQMADRSIAEWNNLGNILLQPQYGSARVNAGAEKAANSAMNYSSRIGFKGKDAIVYVALLDDKYVAVYQPVEVVTKVKGLTETEKKPLQFSADKPGAPGMNKLTTEKN